MYLKECITEIEKGSYSNEAGELKNLMAFKKLKEIVQDNDFPLDVGIGCLGEITESHHLICKRITKMRVESGWLYNFWDYEKDDYGKEWVFVPF